MPQKLKKGMERIRHSNNNKGALYYSNLTITDHNLQLLEKGNISYYGDYLEVLWKSLAFGCTMVFNRELVSYILKYKTPLYSIHDSWLYRVAKFIGSDIFFDCNSYILYRQHGKNAIGQRATKLTDKSICNIIISLKRRFRPRKHEIQRVIQEIYDVASSDMEEREINYSLIALNYNKKHGTKIQMLNFEGIEKRPFWIRLLWYNKVLFNMI